jgi:PIN domain nuclease of toxin-antitoxin system
MQVSPERFSSAALALIQDPDSELLLSAASSWEITIKYALGKLVLPAPPEQYVPDRMRSSGVQPLPIEHSHVLQVGSLPRHHRDPFDRLLIAQAQLENLSIITADRQLVDYDIPLQWAARG